jgi:hypothetical protein
MPGCFPNVRLGEWILESVNYICLTPEGKPQELIQKFPFTFRSQKDGFVFADDPTPQSIIDGFGVWKVDGSKCSNQLIIVHDIVGLIGTLTLNINKRDKSRKVTKFVGNFVQSGFIPDLALSKPVCGIVNAYWVKDL